MIRSTGSSFRSAVLRIARLRAGCVTMASIAGRSHAKSMLACPASTSLPMIHMQAPPHTSKWRYQLLTRWIRRKDYVETVWRLCGDARATDLKSAATHRRWPLSSRMAMLNAATCCAGSRRVRRSLRIRRPISRSVPHACQNGRESAVTSGHPDGLQPGHTQVAWNGLLSSTLP